MIWPREREKEIKEDGKPRRGRPRIEDVEARERERRTAEEEKTRQEGDLKAPSIGEEEDLEAYRQTKAGQHEEEEEYDSPSLGEEQGQEGQEEETEMKGRKCTWLCTGWPYQWRQGHQRRS